MRVIKRSSNFKTSFKRIKKNRSFKLEIFEYVVVMLATDMSLPPQYKDHQLHGKYKNQRECHISPDILLIYEKDDNCLILELIDIGSHAELF